MFKRSGIWHVKYKDVDGKWKNISCGANAKRADADVVKAKYTALELNRRHKMPVRLVEASLADIFKQFIEKDVPCVNKTESSIKREKAALQNIQDYLELVLIDKIKDITSRVVDEFIEHRMKTKKPKTVLEELRIFNKFFRFCIRECFCFENPVLNIKRPKKIEKVPRFFNEDELKKIFGASNEIYQDIFKFLYLTGLRIGELCNMTWECYRQDVNIFVIPLMDGNKTKRETIVHLNTQATEILERRMRLTPPDCKFVFLNSDGNQLDNDNIYRYLLKILDTLQIKDAHPHTFRHTTASHLVMKGVPLFTVRDVLRHKSMKETEIYAHLAEKTIQDAMAILAA
ncbi:MAG: tyrosine-type recombinase/integrase [Fibrobacteres bacterium]|nr:tyrosine-type recombinase/integrase [Fibrobacterota bacterium]